MMKRLLIDPSKILSESPQHQERLEVDLRDLLEEPLVDPADIHLGEYASDVGVSLPEVEEWNGLIHEIVRKLQSGQLFTLHTQTECCAFTTVLHELDIDIAYCLMRKAGDKVFPECIAPLCAFADQDEDDDPKRFDNFEPDETDLLAPWEPPPVRHAPRTWRVTVTCESTIYHDCDREDCPLERPLTKRITFKKVVARTRTGAREWAMDRFESAHKVPEGASWWAEAVCISRPLEEALQSPDR